MEPTYIYRATCVRVVDGDTFHLCIDLGFRVSLTPSCRLYGADTPEMNTAEGKAAREYVKNLLLPEGGPAAPIVIRSYKDQQTFGRWVCRVQLPDGRDLATVLIEGGHAVESYG